MTPPISHDVCTGPSFGLSEPMSHSIKCPDCGPLVATDCTAPLCDCYLPNWHDADTCACSCGHGSTHPLEPCPSCITEHAGLSVTFPLGTEAEAEAWCALHRQLTGHNPTHDDDRYLIAKASTPAASSWPYTPPQEGTPS